MRKNPDGSLTPDLALKYDVSKDGLTYTFTLKNNIYFQDGKPVTADDVVFTINEIKDPTIKSPQKGNWDGVTVQKIDEKTIVFTLKQPYTSFLENTTLGIMPQYLWNNSPIELNDANTQPIGSGPFEVDKVDKLSGGLIDYYDLVPFNKFNLGEPYLSKLTLRFYSSEDDQMAALENGEADQISSISPLNAKTLKEENYRIESATLPRIFGLFFNQNQNQIFTDKNVVGAMNLSINKDNIVRDVLLGYGVVINGPIPGDMINDQNSNNENNTSYDEKVQEAKAILGKDGWTTGADGFLHKSTKVAQVKKPAKTTKTVKDKTAPATVTPTIGKGSSLEFSISTGNAPELIKTADMIQQDLGNIGIKVDIKTFDIGNLNQDVIRPRKYDALLFGEIINNESDLFAFWHSSQRNDPGLNVAMYTNSKVDKLLEEASVATDEKTRNEEYSEFENQVEKDMPAVFLYSPDFIYVVSKDIQGFSMNQIVAPEDRFLNSYLWYTETDNVWKIFSK
jgi:peptide/nickel transport system substrate-binding protein